MQGNSGVTIGDVQDRRGEVERIMKRVTVSILFILLVLGVPGGAASQDGSGGTRSVFTLGAGSRAIAMGGAFTALGDDVSALYYNPAGLRRVSGVSVMANHVQLFSGFSDASYDFIGLACPTVSSGTIGLGFMTVGTGGIREFDRFSRETGEISYRESQLMLAYAFDVPWRYMGAFTLGSSVKVLNQKVGNYSDAGAGMDLGMIYRPSIAKGFVLGFNFQDIIGAETKLVAISEKVDRTLMFSAGYSYLFANGSALGIALQVDVPERDNNDLRVGVEYTLKRIISFRVGYDSEQITAGVGFAWRGFAVDYGYFSRDEAGSSHPVSLSASIGPTVEERIRMSEERKLAAEEERIREIFSKRVNDHIEAARKLREEHLIDQALDELKIALEYDPANEAAAETLIVVRNQIIHEQEEATRSSEKSLLINQHFSLGLKYYSNNEYILSRAEWRNVLELDPDNESARDYLTRTVEKIAGQMKEHRKRAMRLERTGQLAASLGEWNIVRMLDPESEEARTSAERISRRIEELNRVYRATSKRLEIVEMFDEALGAFSSGKYTETIDLCNRVLEKDPDHVEARNLLCRAQRRLIPLTDEEKERIRQLYIAGMKHFSQDNYTEAIEQWSRILEIDPDNESVRKNIEEAEARLHKIGEPRTD